MQRQTNKVFELEEYTAIEEELDGFIFLHLTVHKWGKETLHKMKQHLADEMVGYRERGHDVVFLLSHHEKSVKMWKMIKPLYDLQYLQGKDESGWLGAWLTGEDNGS